MAFACTELGNVPFTKATHASIILSHLPVVWRNQYNLTHKTVPKFPRAMLLDLKNIEKMQVKKYNKKAKASKAKAASAGQMKEAPIKEPPRKAEYYKWCKAVNGSFMTHDTAACCRFEKDGSPKDVLVMPFDSAKKSWKKTGGGESSQMAYLTELLLKQEKKHKSLRSTVRNGLVNCQIVIPMVTRIVGLVARKV